MKRILVCLALLCLLLAACGEREIATTAATEAPAPKLAGVWVNAGQYSEGRDFVETLTLSEDGDVTVHLEYQGADYATLTGTWTVSDGVLNVDFTDPNTKDRVYTYTLTENALTLTGDGKNVSYQRQE